MALARLVEDGERAGHDVVDVGIVPLAKAQMEQRDRAAFVDRLGKDIRRQVGPAPRPIYREETQARGGEFVEMRVSLADQFVGAVGVSFNNCERLAPVCASSRRRPLLTC